MKPNRKAVALALKAYVLLCLGLALVVVMAKVL